MEPWRLIKERPGPAGYMTVVTHNYELPNGNTAEWDILIGGAAIAIVALTTANQVVLVRQYRPGPQRVLDEIPGGGVEPGESPARAAARELAEETGYVGRVEIVGSTWMASSVQSQRWAAVATDCTQQQAPAPDEGELCEPILLSVPEFRTHLRSGQLTDTGAGYMCLDHLDLL